MYRPILAISLFIIVINFGTINVSSYQPQMIQCSFEDSERRRSEKAIKETFNEFGDRAGWTTVAIGFIGALFYPFRRWAFPLLTYFFGRVNASKIYWNINIAHIPIGILTITAAVYHGVLKFYSLDQIGVNEWVGLAAILLLFIGALFGMLLVFKRKGILLVSHTFFITLCVLLIMIHINL